MDQREKERIEAERHRRRAKIAEGAKVIDPIVEVKFNNLEDRPGPGRPSPPFEFCFTTPKGLPLSFRISRSEHIPDTALRDGGIYSLPKSVVDHLNEVKTPVYGQKHTQDPITGALKVENYISGYRNRFALTAVGMANYRVIDDDSGGGDDKSPEKAEKSDKRPYVKKSDKEETNKELAALSASS